MFFLTISSFVPILPILLEHTSDSWKASFNAEGDPPGEWHLFVCKMYIPTLFSQNQESEE